MDFSSAKDLILGALTSVGISMLGILIAFLAVALGYLIFKFGYNTIFNYPGGMGYNSRYGSGMSRFQQGRRNSSGGVNLLD